MKQHRVRGFSVGLVLAVQGVFGDLVMAKSEPWDVLTDKNIGMAQDTYLEEDAQRVSGLRIPTIYMRNSPLDSPHLRRGTGSNDVDILVGWLAKRGRLPGNADLIEWLKHEDSAVRWFAFACLRELIGRTRFDTLRLGPIAGPSDEGECREVRNLLATVSLKKSLKDCCFLLSVLKE